MEGETERVLEDMLQNNNLGEEQYDDEDYYDDEESEL